MKRLLIAGASALALYLSGCGKSEKANLAEGKPIGHWLKSLQADDAQIRRTAVFKLGNVAAADPAIITALIDELNDTHPMVRREAILALVKNGSVAKGALPVLAELQQRDSDATVRACAARACQKLR